MAEDRNENRLSGEFMVQDSDHMVDSGQSTPKSKRGGRQAEQSHSGGRQQGGDHKTGRQAGGDRRQSQ